MEPNNFLEELLKSKVDESAVNALVGSLESRLSGHSRTNAASLSSNPAAMQVPKLSNMSDTTISINNILSNSKTQSTPSYATTESSIISNSLTHKMIVPRGTTSTATTAPRNQSKKANVGSTTAAQKFSTIPSNPNVISMSSTSSSVRPIIAPGVRSQLGSTPIASKLNRPSTPLSGTPATTNPSTRYIARASMATNPRAANPNLASPTSTIYSSNQPIRSASKGAIHGISNYSPITTRPTVAASAMSTDDINGVLMKLRSFLDTLISGAPKDVQNSVKDYVQKLIKNEMTVDNFLKAFHSNKDASQQEKLKQFLQYALPLYRQVNSENSGTKKSQTTSVPRQTTIKATTAQPHSHISTSAQDSKATVRNTIAISTSNTVPTTRYASMSQYTVTSPKSQPKSKQAAATSLASSTNTTVAQSKIVQSLKVVPVITSATTPVRTSSTTTTKPQAKSSSKSTHKANSAKSTKSTPTSHSSSSSTTPATLKTPSTATNAPATTTKDHTIEEEDENDITSMAGVNLMEESAALHSSLISSDTKSCKDTIGLTSSALQNKIKKIALKYGIKEVSSEVTSLISHAAEERLRNIMERLAVISRHRVETLKDDSMYVVADEIRSRLQIFEQLDKLERKRKDEQEKEMLMRIAKSRSRQEDPEQAKLKEKAKQMQLDEEERLRKTAANTTALAAIGRRKRKTEDSVHVSQGTPSQNVLKKPRRIRTATMKDLAFELESEKGTSKSLFLYKAYFKL
ncbi:Transcription initiation factor TFIID subunit 4 [Trichoplax sp. H2]|nr:Transcription initiation factor TFIID subunit 4 [Trichoplax sp. H2]|eukprot:RDD47431.1 Transcription initiation factor TFIID subunit 4 [Trichoplax sp. H2]